MIVFGCTTPEIPQPPNVLLVSLDTLRSDFLAEAPYLTELATEGRSFSQAYASSNWTLPSHLSLFTSLPYSEHGLPPPRGIAPYAGLGLPEGQPTLAEAMSAAGYATAATTEGGWLLPRFGLERGFDHFVTTKALSAGGTTDFEDHLAFAQKFVQQQEGRPFFLFAHTYRVHDYFMNSPEYHDLLLDEDAPYVAWGPLRDAVRSGHGWPPPEFVRRLYTAGVHRTDTFLAQLVAAVRDGSGDAPLLVVVTSDHGESLGEEEGVWGHGHSLEDVQIQVPLVAWSNRREITGNVNIPVSAVDIAPSILKWLGLEVPTAFRGATDRLLANPAPTPVTARHHTEAVEPWQGAIHQLVLWQGQRYQRADRYDGRSLEETCHGQGESAKPPEDCAPHRREMLRRWAERPGGALQFISGDPLTLMFEEDQVAAVQPSLPKATTLLPSPGRLTWTPETRGDFLLVYPLAKEFQLTGIEVAGQSVASTTTLQQLTATPSLPYTVDGREHALVVLTQGISTTQTGELVVAPEVIEQLEALGYLGN